MTALPLRASIFRGDTTASGKRGCLLVIVVSPVAVALGLPLSGDAAEASEINRRIYPHALRATAASQHAYEGLNIPSLKVMFGWKKLSTAEKYIRVSGGRTKRALLELYAD